MKKLISKEEKERLRKRNQVVVGVILVFLMVASTLGYAIQGNLGNNQDNQNPSELNYNGFKFSYVNGFWVLGNFVFKNSPKDIQDINGSELKDAQNYQGKPAYIQSEDQEAEIEATLNLRQIAERVQNACIESAGCPPDFPIKTCNDNFIIIKESEIERISQVDNCVYIEGKKENLIMLTDGFLFKVLGVK
jgi:hypothetical protein